MSEQLGSNPGCCAIKHKPLIDFCWAQISPVLIKTPGAASEGPTMQSLFLPALPQLGAAGYFCKTSLVCTRVYTAPELTQQTTTACQKMHLIFFFPDLLRGAGEKMLLKDSNEGQHTAVFLLRSFWAVLNERIA